MASAVMRFASRDALASAGSQAADRLLPLASDEWALIKTSRLHGFACQPLLLEAARQERDQYGINAFFLSPCLLIDLLSLLSNLRFVVTSGHLSTVRFAFAVHAPCCTSRQYANSSTLSMGRKTESS